MRTVGVFGACIVISCVSSSMVGCVARDVTGEPSSSETSTAVFPVGLIVVPPLPDDPTRGPLPGESPTFAHARAAIDAIVNGATEKDCATKLPATMPPPRPDCFGPSIEFVNHPDGACDSSAKPDPTRGCQFPSGDLGIWKETEGGTKRACTAAKLNADTAAVGERANRTLFVSASMACLLRTKKLELTSVGKSVDLTASLQAALAAKNPGILVKSARVERRADDPSGARVYVYTSTDSLGGVTWTGALKHAGVAAGGLAFRGKLWGFSEGSNASAFSMLYDFPGAASLRYRLASTDITGEPASKLLTASGDIDFSRSSSSNLSVTTSELDPASGLGKHSYAWQAGRGDDSTRVFNVYTKREKSAVAATGCGFFGYGPAFGTTDSTPATINKFICNWAGPGNQHAGVASRAQKQCMTNAGGVWTPTTSAISYSPQVSCASSSTLFRGGFLGTKPADWAPFSAKSTLIDLSTDADYKAYGTGPTLPKAM